MNCRRVRLVAPKESNSGMVDAIFLVGATEFPESGTKRADDVRIDRLIDSCFSGNSASIQADLP